MTETAGLPADRIRAWHLLPGLARLLSRPGQLIAGYRCIKAEADDRRLSIGHIIERNARRWPDAAALKQDERVISHAELNATANRYARVLAEAGIGRGDLAGVLIENRPELILVVTALAKLGAVAVVYNTRLPPAGLAHCVGLGVPTVALVGAECAGVWEQTLAEIDSAEDIKTLRVADGDDRDGPGDWVDLDQAAASEDDSNLAITCEITLADPCFHVFTSGTTGLPKAAIIRHCRWIKAMGAFGHLSLRLKPGQTLYNVLPFYHGTALTVAWAACAATGGALAIGRRFSASRFWDEARHYQAVAMVYIGELCRFLLNQPATEAERRHAVALALGNGLRPDIWDEFKSRFGMRRIFELYGASEANIAFFNFFNLERTVGFCPARYVLAECDTESGELKRDEQGRLKAVEPGQPGLLMGKVTADFPYDGYTDPEHSEAKLVRDAFEPGDCWFNTGDLLVDLGCRHARFVDRLGDTYRWRGENVATTEVEAVAMACEAVESAVAFGVRLPDVEGRAGMLAFRPAPGVDPERAVSQLGRKLTAHLPPYAVPVFLRPVAEVDATGTFKFIKLDLMREGWQVASSDQPVHVRLPDQKDYQPLTPELVSALEQGQAGF